MGKKPQTTTMDKVRTAILGTGGRGSLYRWLRRHHDELQEMLEQVARPDWKAIALALREEKLLDASGKPPTDERVRLTWLKVRQELQEKRSGKLRLQAADQVLSSHLRVSVKPDPPKDAGEATPDANEALARLQRQMDERSGFNPKKKD